MGDVFRADLSVGADGSVVLAFGGDLDLFAAADVGAAVRRACVDRPPALTIDLSNVTYCDSSGLREFVKAAELCSTSDIPMRIVGASRTVRLVFEITGLTMLLADEPE